MLTKIMKMNKRINDMQFKQELKFTWRSDVDLNFYDDYGYVIYREIEASPFDWANGFGLEIKIIEKYQPRGEDPQKKVKLFQHTFYDKNMESNIYRFSSDCKALVKHDIRGNYVETIILSKLVLICNKFVNFLKYFFPKYWARYLEQNGMIDVDSPEYESRELENIKSFKPTNCI